MFNGNPCNWLEVTAGFKSRFHSRQTFSDRMCIQRDILEIFEFYNFRTLKFLLDNFVSKYSHVTKLNQFLSDCKRKIFMKKFYKNIWSGN